MSSSDVYRRAMVIDFEYIFAVEACAITSLLDRLPTRLMSLHWVSFVGPAYYCRKQGMDTVSKAWTDLVSAHNSGLRGTVTAWSIRKFDIHSPVIIL